MYVVIFMFGAENLLRTILDIQMLTYSLSCNQKHCIIFFSPDLPYGWEQETDEKGQTVYVE